MITEVRDNEHPTVIETLNLTLSKMDVNNDHFMTNIAKRKTMVSANVTLETVQLPAPDILMLR